MKQRRNQKEEARWVGSQKRIVDAFDGNWTKYRFRFGKYKGKLATEVPASYLDWFKKNVPRNQW